MFGSLIMCAALCSMAPVFAQSPAAPPLPKAAAAAALKIESEEVLALKAQVQVLKEALSAANEQNARCDVAWAETRAQLNSATLTSTNMSNKSGKEALEESAKRAGFEIDWHLDSRGLPSGEPPTVKKVEPKAAPPAVDPKKDNTPKNGTPPAVIKK
jgi:hypothetical protein